MAYNPYNPHIPEERNPQKSNSCLLFLAQPMEGFFFILYQVPERAYLSFDHQSEVLRIEITEQGERCGRPPKVLSARTCLPCLEEQKSLQQTGLL